MRSLLTAPGVTRFYIADMVSTLGDYALWLAMGIWVLDLTGSSSAAATVLLAYSLGASLSAPLGRLIDRYPRKPLLITCHLATAVLLASLFAVHTPGEVWIVYVVMVLYGVSGGLTSATQAALIPHLLAVKQHPVNSDGESPSHQPAPEMLASANGLQQTLRTLLRLVAPALGAGMLVGLGGPAVAVMDAATFVVAAGLIASLPLRTPAAPQVPRTARRSASSGESGFRFLYQHPVLGPMTFACAASLFVISFSTALSFAVATTVLHHSASYVAVLTTMQGVGALVGGPSAAPLLRRLSRKPSGSSRGSSGSSESDSSSNAGEARLMVLALSGATLATVLRAVPEQYCVLAGNLVIGIVVPWLLVSAITAVQARTPAAMRGRVIAAAALAGSLPQLMGQAAGAGLVAALPYVAVCSIVGFVLSAAATGLATSVRRRTRRPAAGEMSVPSAPVPVERQPS